MTNPEDTIEFEFTVKAKVTRLGMFLREQQATIEEGPFKGTTYCTNVSGGSPILNVERDGVRLGDTWIGLQDLLHAWLPAVCQALDSDAIKQLRENVREA